MIRTTTAPKGDVIIAYPEGALDIPDFNKLAQTVDDYINEHDSIPALVIQADGFPHWASFGAFLRHIRLVKNHERVIHKVAVVSDAGGLSALPALVDHFVKAKIRHFSVRNADEALEWAMEADDDPGSFEELEPIASNVVALRGVGIITAQDYRETLEPLIRKKLETQIFDFAWKTGYSG